MSLEKYRDILDKPYEKSTRHPQMTLSNRAAQFSPFAALTGYDAVIGEAAENFQAADIQYVEEDEDRI